MSRIKLDAWHCDLCHFEWLVKGDGKPEKCASSKCRRRGWDTGLGKAVGDSVFLKGAADDGRRVKGDVAGKGTGDGTAVPSLRGAKSKKVDVPEMPSLPG